MTDQPQAAERISDREAAEVTRRHEDERQRAAKEVADRNRKAHDVAAESPKSRAGPRGGRKKGLWVWPRRRRRGRRAGGRKTRRACPSPSPRPSCHPLPP